MRVGIVGARRIVKKGLSIALRKRAGRADGAASGGSANWGWCCVTWRVSTPAKTRVGVKAVRPEHPLAALLPYDRHAAIESRWYRDNPLLR